MAKSRAPRGVFGERVTPRTPDRSSFTPPVFGAQWERKNTRAGSWQGFDNPPPDDTPTVVSDPTVNVAPVIGATPDVTPAVWSSGASDTQRWEMADTDAGPWSTVDDMPAIDTPYTDQTFGKVLRWVEAQGGVTAESAATVAVYYAYHVDSVNGDDANDGSTPDLAFATLDAVPALTTNQSVGLARGSTFRGQKFAEITANDVSIVAYGDAEAARPIIDSSAVLSSGGWTKTGGQTNVYQRAITFDADVSGYITVFEDDTYLLRQTSIANVDAGAGRYYVTSDSSGSATLYIHTTDSADPASNGKVYEFTDTTLVINSFSATGTVLRDLVFKRSIYQNGPIYPGKNAEVYGCDFLQGSRHNFISRGGLLMEDCAFADGYYGSSGASLFVCYENNGTVGDGYTLRRCVASNTNGPTATSMTGYLNHIGAGGEYGPVTYEDCEALDCDTGFSMVSSTHYTLTGCETTDCDTGYSVGAATDFTLTNCNSTGHTYGVYIAAAAVIEIDGGVYTQAGTVYGGNVYVTADADADATISIHDCTLTSATPTYDGARGVLTLAGPEAHFTIDNVRFAIRRPVNITGASVIDAMDNNSYSTAAVLWTYAGTTSVGLADWRTYSGFDLNSTQDA